jgi:predicted RNA-binding protein with TRAM domain
LKKFHRILGAALLMLIFAAIFSPVAAAASTLSVRLAPTKTAVAPGDTFSVTVKMVGVNGVGGVATADFSVKFDSARFAFTGAVIGGGKPASDLSANASGGTVVLYYADNTGNKNYYTADAVLATLSFTVKSGAAAGTAAFSASLGDGAFGDKNVDPIKAEFSGTSIKVKEKASDNANLKSLNVGNATLSPSFKSGTTAYTADVGFDVDKLKISAQQDDSSALIDISNPTLKAGGKTKVTVTVTAADGSGKTYTITVARAEDPDATTAPTEPADTTLTELKVEGGELAPDFAPETIEYYVQLPFGIDKAVITAAAKDSKAKVKITGADDLKAGKNLVVVTVTAADGTVKEYKITVSVGTEGTTEPTTVYEPILPTAPLTMPPAEKTAASGIAWWWWLVLALLGGLACGALLEHFVLPALDKNRRF